MTRRVVVLQGRELLGEGLARAFPAPDWDVDVWATGEAPRAVRGPVPGNVTVHVVPALAQRTAWQSLIASGVQPDLATNDEYCLAAVERLRHEVGLPPQLPPDLLAWTDKVIMKERCAQAGIAVPAHVLLDPVRASADPAALTDRIGLPLVVKPRRQANNRGVRALHTTGDLQEWLTEHDGQPGWQAETFLDQPMYHANAVVTDAGVHHLLAGAYTAPMLDLSHRLPAGSITLPDDHPAAVAGRDLNSRLCQALGSSGRFVVHTEYFFDASGHATVCETTCRAPGGMVPTISALRTGIHLEEASLLIQTGRTTPEPMIGPHASWTWFPDPTTLPTSGDLVAVRSRYEFNAAPPPGSGGVRSLLLIHDDHDVVRGDLNHLGLYHEPPTGSSSNHIEIIPPGSNR